MRRGQGLPVQTIGIIVLVVIVIVAVAVFFFAGLGEQTAVVGQTGASATEGFTGPGGSLDESQACVAPVCGDGPCCPSEECGQYQECPQDCDRAGCCGCGGDTTKVCCGDGICRTGNCCTTADCATGQTCTNYNCV